MIRDKLNLAFGIGFPVILLVLLSTIQANIPVSMFEIQRLVPGIAVFGLSFVSLFAAVLISKDRQSSFLMRLYSSPLLPSDFLIGYTLPLLPMSLAQSLVCVLVGFAFGFELNAYTFLMLAVLLLCSVFYISLGLLFGSVLNDKQIGGVCGALLTNLTAWLSGVWFDVALVGGVFEKIANALPFIHMAQAAAAAAAGDTAGMFPHLWYVVAYTAVICIGSVIIFRSKMNAEAV